MRLSHHCASCGCDLTRIAGEWVDAFRARIVHCPRCDTLAVRRVDPWRSRKRVMRRLVVALPMLASSVVVLVAGTILLVVVSEMMLAGSGVEPLRHSIRIGEHAVAAIVPVAWLLLAVVIGAWIGAVHPARPVRAVSAWCGVVIGCMMVIGGTAVVLERIVAGTTSAADGWMLLFDATGHAGGAPIADSLVDNRWWALMATPIRVVALAAVVGAAAVPMALVAKASGATVRERLRERPRRILERQRRRRSAPAIVVEPGRTQPTLVKEPNR